MNFFNSKELLAATWVVDPRIDISATYVDNLFLDDEGDEQSDTAYQIIPGIYVSGDGRQFNFEVDYQMQNIFYNHHHEFDDTYHQLDSRADFVLVPNLFYFDSMAAYSQQNISNLGSQGNDNITISGNRTDVFSYLANPYFKHNFASRTTALLGYQYGSVEYQDAGGFDTTDRNSYLEINNKDAGKTVTWKIRADIRDHDSEDGFLWVQERYLLDFGVATTSQFDILFGGGYEKNDYVDSGVVDQGTFWSVGFHWVPSPRTNMTLRGGERFYGNTYFANIIHRTIKWRWDIRYSEDFETAGGLILFGQGDDGTGGVIPPNSDPSIATGVFLLKSASILAERNYSKTRFSLRIFDDKRDYQVSNQDEEVFGGVMDWEWRFASRTNFVATIRAQRQNFTNINRVDKERYLSLAVNRNLSLKSILSLIYSFNGRESTEPDNDYEQNQISLNYRWIL